MNKKETERYKKGLCGLGILSDDNHGMDTSGRIFQVQTKTMSLGEALSSAHAVADLSNSFFTAAVSKGFIKLKH